MHAALLLASAFAAAAVALPAATATAATPDVAILDFTATWCGPCQRMKPLVRSLAASGFPIREVEITKYPEVARRYGVTAYPTFMLVVDGREVTRVTGMQSADGLRQLLASAPRPEPARVPTKGDFVRPVVLAEASGRTDARSASEKFGQASPLAMPPLPGGRPAPSAAPASLVRAQGGDDAAVDFAVDPVDATLRVRVNNARDKQGRRGINFGSATMIAAKGGRVVAVSCAHTFRGIDGESTIEVDLFGGPEGVRTVKAHLVRADPEADVAVIAFVPPGPVSVATVATTAEAASQGDHVFSVGCDEGSDPTKRQHRVTRVNAYVGPDTVECTGAPQTGRSGGGLFDGDGRLVGICFAAELELGRGIYAGLGEVHGLLREAGLGDLVPGDDGFAVAAAEPPVSPGADDFADVLAAAAAISDGGSVEMPTASSAPGAISADGPLEVVCIIRRPGASEAESEVVVINQASPLFLKFLRGESADADLPVAGKAEDGREGFELAEPTSGRLERFTRTGRRP